jgi:hypothetical protein
MEFVSTNDITLFFKFKINQPGKKEGIEKYKIKQITLKQVLKLTYLHYNVE